MDISLPAPPWWTSLGVLSFVATFRYRRDVKCKMGSTQSPADDPCGRCSCRRWSHRSEASCRLQAGSIGWAVFCTLSPLWALLFFQVLQTRAEQVATFGSVKAVNLQQLSSKHQFPRYPTCLITHSRRAWHRMRQECTCYCRLLYGRDLGSEHRCRRVSCFREGGRRGCCVAHSPKCGAASFFYL